MPQPDPTIANLTDDQAMERVARGDRNAFAALVQAYQERAWKVARRFTGNDADARDLVQETFLGILEHAARYKPEGRFSGFLFRILANKAINRSRRSQLAVVSPSPEILASSQPSVEGDAEAALAAARRDHRVSVALASLPPNQKMALVLRYYDDCSYEDIASAMDVSVKAVERLLARGRDALRALLAGAKG